MRKPKPLSKSQRKLFTIVFAVILLIVALVMGVFSVILAWIYIVPFAFLFLSWSYRTNGKIFKKSIVYVLVCFLLVLPAYNVYVTVEYQGIAQSLTSSERIYYFKNLLGRSYNYTELLQWEDATLHWNDSPSMIVYTDPVEIYEYHQARCGGYATLYAELCISQGYQCRLVVNLFGDHEWDEVNIDGNWTRVDASPTGAPMNENIDHPLFYEEKWHAPPILALAFENSSVVDVTSTYRNDHWSLLSGATVMFLLIGLWFALCIFIIWKKM